MLSSKKSSPDHFKEILSTIHENGTSEEEKCQEENLPEVLSKDDENQEKFVDEKKEKLKRIVKESEKVKEKEQESANKDAIGDNNSVEVNKQVDEIEGQSERVEVKKEESEEQIVEVTMKLKIEEKVEEKDSTLPPAENPLTKDEIIPGGIGFVESGTELEVKIQDDNQINVEVENQAEPKVEEQTSQIIPMTEINTEENKISERESNLVHTDQKENQNSQGKGCVDQTKGEKDADPSKEEQPTQVISVQLESSPVEPPHLIDVPLLDVEVQDLIEVPVHEVEVHQVEIKQTDPVEADKVIQIQMEDSVIENGQVSSVEPNPVEEVHPIQRNCQVHPEKEKEKKKDETDGCVEMDRACIFETEDTSNHDTTIESIECMPETPVLSPIVCLRRSLKLRDEKRDKNDKRVSFDPLTLLVTTFETF